MKKINILMSVMLGLGFAACDNLDETPIPTNPQLPAVSANDVVVSLTPELTGETGLNLLTYSEQKQDIPVLNLELLQNIPADYAVDMVMEISNTDDFANTQAVETTLTDANVYTVTAQAWEDAHLELFGKSPKVRTTYVRFVGYAVDGTSSVNLGGPGHYYATATVQVTPFPGGSTIENVYIPGDANGWSFSTILPMTADDMFGGYAHLKGSFKFTGAPSWDEASAESCNWGSGAQAGHLYNGSNDNFSVDTEGLYMVNVNTLALTYTMELISSVGLVGEHNGWSEKTPVEMTPNEDFTVWTAEVDFPKAGAEWKFCMNHGWDLNLGGDQFNLKVDGDNLKSEAAGKTTITLDLSAYPYCFY